MSHQNRFHIIHGIIFSWKYLCKYNDVLSQRKNLLRKMYVKHFKIDVNSFL